MVSYDDLVLNVLHHPFGELQHSRCTPLRPHFEDPMKLGSHAILLRIRLTYIMVLPKEGARQTGGDEI